jgi:hypothetical protein
MIPTATAAAFDILLRRPFTPADFEAFIADRQRTIQDAIENLLIKERLDLPPQLRELDAATEELELKLRKAVEATLADDASRSTCNFRRQGRIFSRCSPSPTR